MPDVKRVVKLVTEQHVLTDKPPAGDFPIRRWNITIWLVNDKGEDVPATIFEKVTYELHPSFEKRAKQVFKTPPFKIEEEGWGEFEMNVILHAVGKGGDHHFPHDLNFLETRYEVKHTVTFRNPKPELLAALEASGGAQENGTKKAPEPPKKRGKKEKNVDMEQLADRMQRLQEDDLLQVVQMIHDQKSPETYTKNDVDAGEFHVDLYTLPDNLVKTLWDFTASKVDV